MLLFETINQPLNFFIIILIGFFCAFIFDISRYFYFLCNKNKIIEKINDILSIIICFCIFFISILILNYGEFRFYLLLGFILGIILQRITFGKIIAKIAKKCYDIFNKLKIKLFRKKGNEIINENNAKK